MSCCLRQVCPALHNYALAAPHTYGRAQAHTLTHPKRTHAHTHSRTHACAHSSPLLWHHPQPLQFATRAGAVANFCVGGYALLAACAHTCIGPSIRARPCVRNLRSGRNVLGTYTEASAINAACCKGCVAKVVVAPRFTVRGGGEEAPSRRSHTSQPLLSRGTVRLLPHPFLTGLQHPTQRFRDNGFVILCADLWAPAVT